MPVVPAAAALFLAAHAAAASAGGQARLQVPRSPCEHALADAGCAPVAAGGTCDACRVGSGVAAGCTKAEVRQFCDDASSPNGGGGGAPLRVAVASDGCAPTVCAALLPALQAAGMAPTKLDGAALAALTIGVFDVLVLPNAPVQLTAGAAPAYFAFAKAGGHIAVLGGRPPRLNVTAGLASLNLMDTYEPYHLRNSVSVQSLPAAAAIAGSAPPAIAGAVSGLSAVAFAREGQSAFVPLLHAVDKHGRSTGWALSAMVNIALFPIFTLQDISTALYKISYHTQ
jgi:hypothetical protein